VISELVGVLDPAVDGFGCGFGRLESGFSPVTDGIGDPIAVLLDRDHYVRQHRQTLRARDHVEVGETRGGQPQICASSVAPGVGQRHGPLAANVYTAQRGGHGIESGGIDHRIELDVFLFEVYARLVDRKDRPAA